MLVAIPVKALAEIERELERYLSKYPFLEGLRKEMRQELFRAYDKFGVVVTLAMPHDKERKA